MQHYCWRNLSYLATVNRVCVCFVPNFNITKGTLHKAT